MTELRLIADDLTGALDSAAAFAPALGPQRVVWRADVAGDALSSATREAGSDEAARRLGALAPFLAPAPDRISLLKVDSLLRGHAGAELAAVLDRIDFDRVIIATAIPFQRRVTRGGRQFLLDGAGARVVGEDVAATLRGAGRAVALRRPGEAAPEGVSLWDAETDADLAAIAAAGRAAGGSILWVGAAGLAAALAGDAAATAVAPPPLLGLIGTDHPVMQGQLAAVTAHRIAVTHDVAAGGEALRHRLRASGVGLASFELPAQTPRATARAEIARRGAALLALLDRPGALFVSGGETLGDIVDALGVEALDVVGAFEPGVPVSRLVGGRWDGLTLVSKSGAFGAPDLLRRLLAATSLTETA